MTVPGELMAAEIAEQPERLAALLDTGGLTASPQHNWSPAAARGSSCSPRGARAIMPRST